MHVDFEKNVIKTSSAQSSLKHLVIYFGYLLAYKLLQSRI